ncbi:hypothetical protein B0H11DRAFT_1677850, partial [Mycena galericulata]
TPPSLPLQESSNSREMDASGLAKGMEEGYAMSAMGNLHREYLAASETLASTYSSSLLLVAHLKLNKEDIWDRGIAKENAAPRFSLKPALLSRVDRVTYEMQTFLSQAAQLVPERETHFVVDPEDSCLPILRGANDLFQLEAAWEIIRSRLELGHRFLMKYIEEFKDKSLAPSSPASTVAALHGEIK